MGVNKKNNINKKKYRSQKSKNKKYLKDIPAIIVSDSLGEWEGNV